MGKPAVSLRHKLIALCAAGLLACGLLPMLALAEDAQDESVAASFVLAASEGSGEAATLNSALPSAADGPTLASTLAGSTTSIVSADVALDAADPVVGSFTADGLTYALNDGGVTLISVAGGFTPPASKEFAAGEFTNISIPASVTYNDMTYPVTAIGPYAFYLSGATQVELPASVASVDGRAFRSSDVERVDVDAGNPNLTSFDGALYSADDSRLLLIPEGRKGSVLLSCETEVVQASLFSHCSLMDAISVEEGGAAFSSWDGLLYSAHGTTLLRVPAGATEITIRDGCTTIAAGAMEGCAKLERINAPASVTSISPDVFTSIPTIALPAQSALRDKENPGVASALADQSNVSTDFIPQITAMVALSAIDDDLPETDPSSIQVALPEDADIALWQTVGFSATPIASIQSGSTFQANVKVQFYERNKEDIDFVYQDLGFIAPWSSSWSPTVGTQALYNGMNSPLLVAMYNFTGTSGGTKYGFRSDVGMWVWRDNGSYGVFWDGEVGNPLRGVTLNSPNGTPLADGWQGEFVSNMTFYYTSVAATSPKAILTFSANSGAWPDGAQSKQVSSFVGLMTATPEAPSRDDYDFLGWTPNADGSEPEGGYVAAGVSISVTGDATHYAAWRAKSFNIGFDTSSEPGDVDCPGDAMDDKLVGKDEGQVPIEDPKRPGYVFEGWVIPTEDGTEAVDQELVYQGDDGKWYVDASKLPDYADADGKVELTARWTSVISVDVPSSVTFYADLVTQGQESREGAASGGGADGAFGQNKVANQSQVDLRVVGLESSAVKTEGSTLGADSILKKADAAPPATSAGKLLSLYPSTKQWKPEELRDPDAVGGTKPASVDFDLDDILLEKSFTSGDLPADAFTITAGGTLNMGYRLNLSETGQQLDYDKLSTLDEGQSAAIANVAYTFACEGHSPTATGSKDDPLWIEYEGSVYGLKDIKASAECISEQGTASPCYPLYKKLLDAQVMHNGTPIDSSAPYFQLKVDGVYLPLQLIGVCQDTKSDGTGKAGLTFQMRDIYASGNKASTAAGGGTFNTYMNPSAINSGGWQSAAMRSTLRSTFWNKLSEEARAAIVPVTKHQQLPGGATASYLQKTTGETIWLPSMYEVFGTSFANFNESEALTTVFGYTPFQYMAYQPGGTGATNNKAVKTYNGSAFLWSLRSARQDTTNRFCGVYSYGSFDNYSASDTLGAAPCFCL